MLNTLMVLSENIWLYLQKQPLSLFTDLGSDIRFIAACWEAEGTWSLSLQLKHGQSKWSPSLLLPSSWPNTHNSTKLLQQGTSVCGTDVDLQVEGTRLLISWGRRDLRQRKQSGLGRGRHLKTA
ncbi:unnamed protein product, partial [Choristocarpus tenellus]